MTFQDILAKYRSESFSERDKGNRFERLIAAYHFTVPTVPHVHTITRRLPFLRSPKNALPFKRPKIHNNIQPTHYP